METIHIKIKPTQRVKRNTMHFQTQLNNRMHIQENKKAYNRKRMKQSDLKENI